MRLKQTLFLSACIVLALVAITSAATALTITSITPTSAFPGDTITATVTGTGFGSGIQFWLVGGGTTIQASDEAVVSYSMVGSSKVTGTLAIPSTAYVGSYTLYVANPHQLSVPKAGAFTVGIKPTITSVSPDSVSSEGGTIPGTGVIYGSGFIADAQVEFTNGETTIQATNEVTMDSGTIYFALDVPATAPCGAYSVSVTNPGFPKVTKASAFTKTQSAITVGNEDLEETIDPSQGNRGQTITTYVLGNGFTQGCQVRLTNGATTISATNEFAAAPYALRCTLTLPSTAPLGDYTISVQDPSTGEWISGGVYTFFTVLEPLTVASMTPASGSRGSYISAVVKGTNFPVVNYGNKVRLTCGGTIIDVHADWENSDTEIAVDFTIPSTAKVGFYTLSVQAAGTNTWITKTRAFKVTK